MMYSSTQTYTTNSTYSVTYTWGYWDHGDPPPGAVVPATPPALPPTLPSSMALEVPA